METNSYKIALSFFLIWVHFQLIMTQLVTPIVHHTVRGVLCFPHFIFIFSRYRGLQSFHSSPWDPKENLPRDYARIFQFENFRRTQKTVLLSSESDNSILVCVTLLFIITVRECLLCFVCVCACVNLLIWKV